MQTSQHYFSINQSRITALISRIILNLVTWSLSNTYTMRGNACDLESKVIPFQINDSSFQNERVHAESSCAQPGFAFQSVWTY